MTNALPRETDSFSPAAKAPPIQQFEGQLQELYFIVSKRIRRTGEEQEKIAISSQKERKIVNLVSNLMSDVDKAKNDRHEENKKKSETIRGLKGSTCLIIDELKEIKRRAAEISLKIEENSKQKEQVEIEASKVRENSIILNISTLNLRLEQEIERNRQKEALGRRKLHKIEGEIQNWILKYDQEMGEKQKALDLLAVNI